MEVILLEKVKNLGELGDTVKVKSGYGRNFLLPQGKALPATDANRKVFEVRKAELIKKATESLGAAKLRAEQINGKTVTIKALAAEEGKLYGSVGPADVAKAATTAGFEVRKAEVDMPSGPIRQTGSYTVNVRLHTEVEATLTVVVEEEKAQ
ncbi:MAG: 50S ribosomal protein L9 [Gammaproteobacteria bacterium]|nr:50S ribosomal protein L9 [Gammaproteobacteria bacterium]